MKQDAVADFKKWDEVLYQSYGERKFIPHSRYMKDYLNPYGVKYRESCDSMDNPTSTAIIFGLDVYFEGRGVCQP
ncbi:MAG: hypothetical protein K2H52_00580 [Lachnospiraceae bacterium]|nr:hypothetical protein [Lachnospiraceae bacterium]MDE7285340.1 hypothetical protein [Lachnospiraceae bacterium]